MLGFISLTSSAFIASLIRSLNKDNAEYNIPSSFLLIPVVTLTGLYLLSRKRFNNLLVYVFILFISFLGTYSLYEYGYVLPQGLLIYALVIIMSGILLSAKTSVFITGFLLIILVLMAATQIHQKTNPYIIENRVSLSIENLIVYIFIFGTIFLVSWLSNREIETSLRQAKKYENNLLAEQDMLEGKIKARTKELEKAQVEKSMELYRFAEFGRLSSSFLHDLANPLTAVSLNLEHLSSGQKPRIIKQVRQSVKYMEQYVESARVQLRSQSEITTIDTKSEILKVKNFLNTKARQNKVTVYCRLSSDATLLGDTAKFGQITANLIANAIDSYNDSQKIHRYSVFITSKINLSRSLLILTIKDNGVGIPLNELDLIFNPFFTTKSYDRGTGIGLTITKRIVEEDFMGNIYVESGKNGTTFFVELPLHKT